MNSGLLAFVKLALGLAACGDIPYRKDGFAQYPECRAIYDRHDDITSRNKNVTDAGRNSRCWRRSREERNIESADSSAGQRRCLKGGVPS